jgi:hypothetical protein
MKGKVWMWHGWMLGIEDRRVGRCWGRGVRVGVGAMVYHSIYALRGLLVVVGAGLGL